MVHTDRRYRPQNTVLTSNMFNIASNREHDISKINVYICSVRRERTRGRITGCNVPENLSFSFQGDRIPIYSYSNVQKYKIHLLATSPFPPNGSRNAKPQYAPYFPHFFHFLFVLEHDQTSLLCSSLINRDLHKSSA